MAYTVLIAEDERLVREELVYLLKKEDDFRLVATAENGRQLVEAFRKHRPHCVFLDIHMPEVSGMEAARRLRRETVRPPVIVFVTAYDEYAVQAFDLEACDYLLKPFDEDRLHQAMKRVRKKLGSQEHQGQTAHKLLVEEKEKMIVLDPAHVFYAARSGREVEIYAENGMARTQKTLKELEEELVSYPFFRTHRSYLVNLDYVQEIVPWFNGAYNLILHDRHQTKIPVSRQSVKPLLARFSHRSVLK